MNNHTLNGKTFCLIVLTIIKPFLSLTREEDEKKDVQKYVVLVQQQ